MITLFDGVTVVRGDHTNPFGSKATYFVIPAKGGIQRFSFKVPGFRVKPGRTAVGGILPEGYDTMTEKESRAFERTCELFGDFIKRKKRNGN